MAVLVPCPGCARHVRTTETFCPFCAMALDLAEVPPPLLPTERLSRSATLRFQSLLRAGAVAVAAATVSNLSSCTVPVYGKPGFPEGDAGGGGEAGDLAAGAGGEDGGGGSP